MRVSRYKVFCCVVDAGSFTKAARELGYTQSAVSQTVRALEAELGASLLERGRGSVSLTGDGRTFMPAIRAVAHAEDDLERRRQEVAGLLGATIRVGTFSSVSRRILPSLMHRFEELHPDVRFVLRQGEYTSIAQWVGEDRVDLGFINGDG
ncbi:MAG: LysR family transcriptional regulator, partial [Parafannyhessea umbonata]|nr:LysR family transcriptional regulator [Parafannyhessea umbonata]